MVAKKNIPKNKMKNNHVTITQESLYSMIQRKGGHAVIKLSMIGMNLRRFQLALRESTLTSSKKGQSSINPRQLTRLLKQ